MNRKSIEGRAALAVSIVALMIALTGTAFASGLISGSHIRANSITTKQLKNDGITGTDIRSDTIEGSDIGENQVTPEDVALPPATSFTQTGKFAVLANGDYQLVDSVGSYTKAVAESTLDIQWSGTAARDFSACLFQIRVDGQPAAPDAGVAYVNGSEAAGASALFKGLPAGPHQIEIWTELAEYDGGQYPCVVGPNGTGSVGQSFVITEGVS